MYTQREFLRDNNISPLLLLAFTLHKARTEVVKMDETVKSRIKRSIPFLSSSGEELTSRMYEILFEKNPELRSLFEGDNSKKLAGALLAVAQNLERLNVLEASFKKIALSHVRAGVKPEHYEKVWEALYKAMVEFGIENEIIEAWKEVYHLLADDLIKREEKLYACLMHTL